MWEQIRRNRRNSAILVIFMAIILLGLGYLLGETLKPGYGPAGLGVALIIWLIMSLVAYFGGSRLFLALGKARKIQKSDHPQLWNVVEEMTIASGLPRMPEVYVIDDRSPNAFATGRDPTRCAVAVTSGLLEICNRDELQGVIAHEISHVKNRDVLFMVLIGVMVGAIVMLSDIGLRSFFFRGRRSRRSGSGSGQVELVLLVATIALVILAPILARLIYFACSRKREYLADASAAQFTRYPEGLASALEKLSGSQNIMENPNRVMLPMYINNPKRSVGGLSSTHPPIEQRVRILRAMASGASLRDYERAYRQETKKVGMIPHSSLLAAKPVEKRSASEGDGREEKRKRVRQTEDLLWRLTGYLFITCSCGTKLKIPPALKVDSLNCPHCGTTHTTKGRIAAYHSPHQE